MPTSVRFDRESQERLQRLAEKTGRTKSELIREAIVRLDEFIASQEKRTTYERIEGFVGVVRSGGSDRAERAEAILREGLGRRKRP